MNAINNLVKASKNLVNTAGSTVDLGSELVCKGAELFNSCVREAVPCAGAVARLPFNATEGYLVQEGMEPEAAHEQAYRFVNQKLSVTIDQVGVGLGKLSSDLLKEDAK